MNIKKKECINSRLSLHESFLIEIWWCVSLSKSVRQREHKRELRVTHVKADWVRFQALGEARELDQLIPQH